MTVQARQNIDNRPFLLSGCPLVDQNATLLQDAGRTTVLAYGTVMVKVAASQKWEPFTDETATDGTAIPLGIFVGHEVAAADLVAGDVLQQAIWVGGNITLDGEQLVIENSKTLATVITVGTTLLVSVRDFLKWAGIHVEETIAISEPENT